MPVLQLLFSRDSSDDVIVFLKAYEFREILPVGETWFRAIVSISSPQDGSQLGIQEYQGKCRTVLLHHTALHFVGR